MAKIWRHQLRRFVGSGSRVLLIGGPAVVSVAVASWIKGSPEIPWWLIGGGIGGVILLGYQAWSEYQHRTFDPKYAFIFDDRLYGDEIREARFRAAKILRDNQGKLRSTN